MLAAFSLFAIPLSGCREGSQPSQAQGQPPEGGPEVTVVVVQPRDTPIYAQWIGTLDGSNNAQIRAEITGYLLSQDADYRDGDLVHQGDPLFHVDARPLQAALNQAKATLAKSKALAVSAQIEYNRIAGLYQRSTATKNEFDQAVAHLDAANATVDADAAALDNAKVQLSYCTILSPVDGIAGVAAAQIGDLVGPAGPVLTTVSVVDPIKVTFTISEQEYLALGKEFLAMADASLASDPARGAPPGPAGRGPQSRPDPLSLPSPQGDGSAFGGPRPATQPQLGGQPGGPPENLELTLADGQTYPRRGWIHAVQRAVDIQTGAIEVQAEFRNPGNVLRPGQYALIRAQTAVRPAALLVPQRAVIQFQDRFQVAIVGPGEKVHMQPVRVGERIGSEWIIEQGLGPGDRVIVEGLQKVREGAKVSPRPFVPQGGAGPTTERSDKQSAFSFQHGGLAFADR